MIARIFVKPKEGVNVPDEKTGQNLPDGGCEVDRTIYILRRINDGDLIVIDQSSHKKKA